MTPHTRPRDYTQLRVTLIVLAALTFLNIGAPLLVAAVTGGIR